MIQCFVTMLVMFFCVILGPSQPVHSFALQSPAIIPSYSKQNRHRSVCSKSYFDLSSFPQRRVSPSKQPRQHQYHVLQATPAASMTPISSMGTSLALIISSLFGLKLDQKLGNGGGASGILGSMALASIGAKVIPRSIIPASHPLHDLCWTFFLPASLTFMLLTPSSIKTTTASKNDLTDTPSSKSIFTDKENSSIATCIRRVAGPFFIATIGSLLGCWLSFRLAVTTNIFPTIADAKLVASCVAASYVGGSINCFATARIIQAPPDLLANLATADLLSMAIYFGCLSATLNWNWLRSKFLNQQRSKKVAEKKQKPKSRPKGDGNPIMEEIIAERVSDITVSFKDGKEDELSGAKDLVVPSATSADTAIPPLPKVKYVASLLAITFGIVRLATRIESFVTTKLKIPGTACAVIAVIAPWVQQRFKSKAWWKSLTKTSSLLADFCFLMFFASIGITSNSMATSQASYLTTGPACLAFSLLALLIHFGITIIGSLMLFKDSSLEDTLTASNAAIGGPTAAAAFCQRMIVGEPSPQVMQGRTIAATVWGVIGYAIGTMLGVGMFQIL